MAETPAEQARGRRAAVAALGETLKHQRGVVVERNRPLPVAEDPGDFDHLLGETPE